MNYVILWKSVEAGLADQWTHVADVRDLDQARDELAGWQGPRLSHGDLVAVGGPRGKTVSLNVFDGATSAFVELPFARSKDWTKWFASAPPAEFVFTANYAGRKRLVLAAAECVDLVLPTLPSEQRAQMTELLQAPRSWALGRGTSREVTLAAVAANDAATEMSAIGADDWQAIAEAVSSVAAIAYVKSYQVEAANAVRTVTQFLGPERVGEVQEILRRRIPLSVILCAKLGLKDPLPISRDNPWISSHKRRS